MNAILLCAGPGKANGGQKTDRPGCLQPLAGQPVLAYILQGIARLGLTQVVMNVASGARQIRALTGSCLPNALVRFVPCPDTLANDSLGAVARALRFVKQTGLLLIEGTCIFDPVLPEAMIDPEVGALPYVREKARRPPGFALSLEEGRVAVFGRDLVPTAIAGWSIGLCYVPRTYLPLLRGTIVELMAAGAADAPYGEAFRVMIERGVIYHSVDASEYAYAEIKEETDLPRAISVALELQRSGRKGKTGAGG